MGRGRSNQAAWLPGSAPALMGSSHWLLRKGALCCSWVRAKAPLPPQPSPLPPPSPGLRQAVPCEQKGAFVCPAVGTGRCGDGQASGPHRNSCCGAGLDVPACWIYFCLSIHSSGSGDVCQKQHGGGLALSLVVPFHAFKPLSGRASVSPSLVHKQWFWWGVQQDGCH